MNSKKKQKKISGSRLKINLNESRDIRGKSKLPCDNNTRTESEDK